MTDTGTLVRIEADGEGHVVEIVLDRPEALNAVSTAMATALAAATARVAADPNVRCVVLRSSQERAFCVGADLKERNAFTDADLVRQRPVARGAYRGVLDLPVPAIAAVEGYALGGGYELALSCDLIVAGETATVGLPEVSVGVIPGGGGTQLLTRRVGWSRAASLVFTARRLPAPEALSLGCVDEVVPGRHRPRPGPRAGAADRRELAGRPAAGQAGDAARRGRRPGHRTGGRGRLLAGHGLQRRPRRGRRGLRRTEAPPVARTLNPAHPLASRP